MLSCVSVEEFIDFTLKIVETSMLLMDCQYRMSGKEVSQHVFIFDLEGFSMKVLNFPEQNPAYNMPQTDTFVQ